MAWVKTVEKSVARTEINAQKRGKTIKITKNATIKIQAANKDLLFRFESNFIGRNINRNNFEFLQIVKNALGRKPICSRRLCSRFACMDWGALHFNSYNRTKSSQIVFLPTLLSLFQKTQNCFVYFTFFDQMLSTSSFCAVAFETLYFIKSS